VECDSVDKTVCSDFTAGGSLLPTAWCFANGNWTEGAPIRLSIERENATAAALSAAGLLEFAAHCVEIWDGHLERIRASRYVSSRAAEAEALLPPPLAHRRELDPDKPPSGLRGIREKSETAAPKKAMEMEYVPHVSENQGRLPRAFRSGGADEQQDGGGGGSLSSSTTRQKKKLKSVGPKSPPVVLESGLLEGSGSGGGKGGKEKAGGGVGTTAAMRRVDENIRETTEERR
jgi:hypothetical protein